MSASPAATRSRLGPPSIIEERSPIDREESEDVLTYSTSTNPSPFSNSSAAY
jgi:hypothetical protein